METFRFLLFGIAGVSVVFWVAIIALWHTYMFPTFFNEDKISKTFINEGENIVTEPIFGNLLKSNNFKSRDKYSMRNLVVADFSSTNKFKLNRLYTTVMLGVSLATFIYITYGLSSSITAVS